MADCDGVVFYQDANVYGDALSGSVWHRSVCGSPTIEVVAESDGIHHLVEAGIAGHLAGIREVEFADAETNLPDARETKFRAQGLLKHEIEVGAIRREGLLRISDNAALGSEVGLQHLAVAPEHAETDRRDRETGYRGRDCGLLDRRIRPQRRVDAAG